jgi:deazaflavin-dependent oxidoreductase (nitroreductase family)
MTRYLAPGWLVRNVLNPVAMRTGMAAVLSVKTRKTGRRQTLPVNVLEFDGTDYLVSVRGETQWVRNLRAAGECEVRGKGESRRLAATEIPIADRAPIVGAYRQRWGAQVRRYFAALPDDADHPVFALRRL